MRYECNGTVYIYINACVYVTEKVVTVIIGTIIIIIVIMGGFVAADQTRRVIN